MKNKQRKKRAGSPQPGEPPAAIVGAAERALEAEGDAEGETGATDEGDAGVPSSKATVARRDLHQQRATARRRTAAGQPKSGRTSPGDSSPDASVELNSADVPDDADETPRPGALASFEAEHAPETDDVRSSNANATLGHAGYPDAGADDGAPPSQAIPPTAESESDVAARIRELEARLDRMIDEAARGTPPRTEADARASRTEPPKASNSRGPGAREDEATVFDTARELLSTDYYLRKWGRLGMRNRSEEVDDFGFDPVYEERALPIFNFLYEKYFRVECDGAAGIPDGRCLLVANHSGTVPYDGLMMKLAVKREHPNHRSVRWLAEDSIFHFPFLGSFTNRIGAVRACQENAERLLNQEALVAVFPEGVKGIGKLFRERYRLQRFGRGGFIKLCLRTRTPIVPVAVVGAEETNPLLAKWEAFTRPLGLPYLPITPTFPLLGPLGLLPAPTKWRILFGEVQRLDDYGPEAADDEMLVNRLAERVRATIQAMLDRAINERRSVWLG